MRRKAETMGIALILGLVSVWTGCATILTGTGQGMSITSRPSGAEVLVDNESKGITPVSAKLRRKENHTVVIRLDGYEPYETVLTRQTSGWVFGNILFGPGVVIGIAVDAISGGMYKFEPSSVNADLGTKAKATSSDGKLHVVLVPKANPEWIKVGQLERVAAWE